MKYDLRHISSARKAASRCRVFRDRREAVSGRHEATSPRMKFEETWLSGRKYLTANEASCKRLRGFESLRLRI